jgi:hypothetical protein
MCGKLSVLLSINVSYNHTTPLLGRGGADIRKDLYTFCFHYHMIKIVSCLALCLTFLNLFTSFCRYILDILESQESRVWSLWAILYVYGVNSGRIHSPWMEYIVDCGQPASLRRLAGRYDNPLPESTLSPPSQWLRIWLYSTVINIHD